MKLSTSSVHTPNPLHQTGFHENWGMALFEDTQKDRDLTFFFVQEGEQVPLVTDTHVPRFRAHLPTDRACG